MERWNENKVLENATKRLLSNHPFIWEGKSGHQRRTQVNKWWTCEDCILQNWIIYLQVTGTDILILENEIPCLSKKLFTLYNVWKYGSSIFVQSEILYNTVCIQASSNINKKTSSKSITILELWIGESLIYLCLSNYKNIKKSLSISDFTSNNLKPATQFTFRYAILKLWVWCCKIALRSETCALRAKGDSFILLMSGVSTQTSSSSKTSQKGSSFQSWQLKHR